MPHPEVGVSEFAQTMIANLKFLAESSSKFLMKPKFQEVRESLGTLEKALLNLDVKNEEMPACPEDIKTMLKIIIGNDEDDEVFKQMFEFGGMMYLLGSIIYALRL